MTEATAAPLRVALRALALEEHPLIKSVCMVGVPDDNLGRVPVALVECADEVGDAEFIRHLRQRPVTDELPWSIRRLAQSLRDDAGNVRRSARTAVLSAADPP